MENTDKKKRRISRKCAWILQGLAIIILVTGISLIFGLSDDERFEHVMNGEGYASTANFGYQFYSDVEKAIRYTKLAEKLETDGELDYGAYVAEMIVAEDVITCFTLQDAVDYGETLGLYFDDENRLVTKDGKRSWRKQMGDNSGLTDEKAGRIGSEDDMSEDAALEKSAVYTDSLKDEPPEGVPEIVKERVENDLSEEEFLYNVKEGIFPEEKLLPPEDLLLENNIAKENTDVYDEELEEFTGYYTGDLKKEMQEERKFLLKLLYQLAEYYELRAYLGIGLEEDTINFAYRFVYLNDNNKVVVDSNRMNSGSVQDILDLGYYFWMDSERDYLTYTFYADVVSSVYYAVAEGGLLSGDTHEIVAGVDLEFPVQDHYAREYHAFQQYRWMLYGSLAVALVGMLSMLAAFFLLLRTCQEVDSPLDSWYTEAALFLLLFVMLLLGGSVVLIQDSFRDYDVPTLCTGIFFAVLMYYPVVTGTCSMVRRWKKGDVLNRSLSVWAGRELKDSYQSVLRGRFRLFWVVTGYLLANVILSGVSALILEDIFLGNGTGLVGILILGVCLLGVITVNSMLFIYAGRRAGHGRRITDALNAISGGIIDTKIDTGGMRGQDREMAEAINTIGEGLVKAVEEKTRSERMKTDLIANVSHDLRTPLTSIINYVDLLKREDIPNSRAKEYLKILEGKSLRMKQLTEDLVDASKVSSGNMTVNWNRIDLVQMVNQMEGEYQERLEAAELIPVTNLVSHPVYIQADGRLLFRVLENLYNNVCKYAMKGTRVYIDLRETSHKVIFTMKNISADPLNITADELTGRFVRGDASRTSEGSGLGLSIAQSITELLNGTFEIYLEGDLFRVRLVFPLDETDRSV